MSYTDCFKISLIGGSYRITVPIDWVRENSIANKTPMEVIVNRGVLILPPKKLSEGDIDRMFEDLAVLTKMAMRERAA